MALQVPSVQLESNAPPTIQGGNIQQMKDVVSEPNRKLAQAQSDVGKQFNAISVKLQGERDDAVSTELQNEYKQKVAETKLKYKTLENKNAVAQVDTDENGDPITVREKYVQEMSDLLEEYAERGENDTQKYLIRTNGEAVLNSANNVMTVHEITEGQKYADSNEIAAINLATDVTGQDYTDHHDPQGEFAKNEATILSLIGQRAQRKGLEMDSPTIKELIQTKMSQLHSSTLDQMMLSKDFDEAKLYLETNVANGKINASLYQTYAAKVNAGFKKHKGSTIGELHITSPHNINTGNISDVSNAIFKLESSTTFDNGNGVTVANGFNSNEVNTTQQTREDAKNLIGTIAKESKADIVPQHNTHHTLYAMKLGVKKADQLFASGKRELKEAGITPDSEGYDAKLLDKVISLAEKPLFAKYGKRDSVYLDKLNKDIQILKKQINYDLNAKQETLDEKTGLPLYANIEKNIRESLTDKDELEAALTQAENLYNQEKDNREEVYDGEFAKAMSTATEEGGSYLDVDNIDMFTKEDQQKIKNGHAEESDTNTYTKLYTDPVEILPENIEKYRHLLSKTDFRTLQLKGQKLKNGGEAKVLEATMDSNLFKDILSKNGFDNEIYGNNKSTKVNQMKVGSILTAVENRIDYAQRIEGRKLTRDEKAQMVYNVLADEVSVDNRNILGDRKGQLYSGLKKDQLDDTYVNVKEIVDGEIKTSRIYGDEIPTKVMVAIQGSLYERGVAMSQKEIAKEWVKFGRPMSLREADKNIKATRIYGLMAG